MSKEKIRNEAINFLSQFGTNLNSKFRNVCGKTGQYNVPDELFQKRTKRSNRILMEWKIVKDNNLTMEQLETFEGGVVIEFVNNDFFDKENINNSLFNILKDKLGSNDKVSAIISIRSEQGISSSQLQRDCFSKLINNTEVLYNDKIINITKSNYKEYIIKQIKKGKQGIGSGNEWWTGFLFISIKGGQQDTLETHSGKKLTLFNPACEYASKEVCLDIDFVMLFFAFMCVNKADLELKQEITYETLLESIKKELKLSIYNSEIYKGNLLDYCENHPSIKLNKGKLTDPIQLRIISIDEFNITERAINSIDFTHGESVLFQKFYWDSEKKCILSPARPTNIFWSYHLSNMMQQNYSLEEYFRYEKERFEARQRLLENRD